jgi:hypothetical protein
LHCLIENNWRLMNSVARKGNTRANPIKEKKILLYKKQ